MVVGRRSRQRRVHADVPFIPREGPVDDAPLHGFRDALVSLFDALEGDGGGDDLGGDVEERRRGARPAAGARRARRHGAGSAARRGLAAGAPPAPRPAPGDARPESTRCDKLFIWRHNVRYIIKSWHFCVVLQWLRIKSI